MIFLLTNSVYNYFRDYDPSTGRYAQSDPLGLVDSLATYSYAYSNPYMHFDPLGLACDYLGKEWGNTVTTTSERNTLLGKTWTYGPGPRPPNASDCLGPPSRTRLPCSFGFDIKKIFIEFWKTETFSKTTQYFNHVYRCTDDCTGEVTYDRIKGSDSTESATHIRWWTNVFTL